MNQSIYLLQEREFVNSNENVYKIGKTTQEGLRRLSNYPKGSRLLLQIHCNDCTKCEIEIIDIFKKNFISRDESKEHFQGSCELMITLIYEITKNDRIYSNSISKEINKDSTIPTTHKNKSNTKIIKKEEIPPLPIPIPNVAVSLPKVQEEPICIFVEKEKQTQFPLQCPFCPHILKNRHEKSYHLNQKPGPCKEQYKKSKESK